MQTYRFNLVVVGGTFDRLHKGHESLLRTAFTAGKFVLVGITSDEMVRGKVFADAILPFDVRREEVQQFLKKNNWHKRADIVQLQDEFGSLGKRSDIEALIVGPRYRKDVVASVQRKIRLVHAPVEKDESGSHISSTAIRRGVADRGGMLFKLGKGTLVLPGSVRTILKSPLGTLQQNISDETAPFTITVGDATTARFLTEDRIPDIAIVDLAINRKKHYGSIDELGFPAGFRVVRASNPPGTITQSLRSGIDSAINSMLLGGKTIVLVEGEDDLSALLCILRAPLLSVVYYGQPSEGLVKVVVTEERKKYAYALLQAFTQTLRSDTMSAALPDPTTY